MTNNKQQTDHIVEANKMVTAVQSIIQKINNVKPSDFCSIETIKQWCEQAKEIEKERLTDAYCDGKANGMDISHPLSLTKQISANEWYNETYGGGEQ
jgi:hypothetical protein